jgi:hypothetical protein
MKTNEVEQYEELLSTLIKDIHSGEDIIYCEEICFSAKMAFDIECAENMIKYGKYETMNDKVNRIVKVIDLVGDEK